MSDKTYYLFGSEAAKIYLDNDIDYFCKAIALGLEHKLFVYDDNCNQPSDLLEAYDGWNGYAILTEEDYRGIRNALHTSTYNRVTGNIDTVIQSCHEALDGDWDRSDGGFKAMITLLQQVRRDVS